MRKALVLTALLALPAMADEGQRLTAEEFDSYSRGKTLSYATSGEVYGMEQYLPGRQVLWAFKGQECSKGYWYEEAELICFVYEHDGTPQCWSFFRDANGLRAKFAGDPDGAELSEVAQTPNPLICAGPDVGV